MPQRRSRRFRRRPEPLLSRDAALLGSTSNFQADLDEAPRSYAERDEASILLPFQASSMDDDSDPAQPAVSDERETAVDHERYAHDLSRSLQRDDLINKHVDNISERRNGRNEEDISADEGMYSSDKDSESDHFPEEFKLDLWLDIFEERNDDSSKLHEEALQADETNMETVPATSSISDVEVQKVVNIISWVKRFINRGVLLGMISLYGKIRYTLEHYEHLVVMMKDEEKGTNLPSSSKMRKYVFPQILKKLFVKSKIETFPMKAGFSSYLPTSSNLSSKQTEAVVVLPSSWARIDVRSLHVLREIACIESCRCGRTFGSSDLRVDSTNHVIKRNELSRHSDTLWINKSGVSVPSTPGMTVKFHTANENVVSDIVRTFVGFRSEKVRYRGELCSAFNADILSTVHVRYSTDSGVYLEDGIKPGSLDANSQRMYSSCIRYLETLCQCDHKYASASYRDGAQTSSDGPQTRRQLNRRHDDNRLNRINPYLVPSDHITIVTFENSNVMGVFVSRYWVQRLDDERNLFLFLTKNNQGSISCTSILIIGAPVYVKNSTLASSSSSPLLNCRTTGKLEDGTRYYMYRLILYADDFNPRSTLFPKGSVGGLYMSPSSFHTRSRRSQSTIRTISLTPAGVSTNSVIDFLIDDLVRGSIDGIDCVDAFGQIVRVFFDVMGFIGDYPASSAVVDLKGHNATAPCTHCGFTFNKSTGVSTFAYITSITSCNTAYRRSQSRTESIREAGLSDYQHKFLGMSVIDQKDFRNCDACPLLKFASVHNEALSNHVCALPFETFDKDGYTLNLVAPDHLITGLFKGVLLIIFMQLPDDDARDRLQICLKSSLAEFGFQSQSVLYKCKKKKLVPGLSMSILYCILTVIPSTLQALNLLEDLPSKRMLVNLNRLFALSFWWPTMNHDGQKAWRFVHGCHIGLYHQALQILASNFVKCVDKFHKSFPSLSCYIDRPNIHRLLELVHHTMPMFNHLLYVCELVFESAHQPLKFSLSRNHTLNSHVYAVHLSLAKDWMIRIWSLWRIYRNEHENNNFRQYALIGLIRLFGGEDADNIYWKSPALTSYLDDIRDHIHHLMIGTVEKSFDKWYSDARMTFNSEPFWVLHPPPKAHKFSNSQNQFFGRSLDELSRLCIHNRNGFKPCYKALLTRGFGSSAKSSHERMHIGDVIQVLLKPGYEKKRFPSTFISPEGLPNFFVVGGFIQSDTGTNWAIVKKSIMLSPSNLGQLPDHSATPFIEVSTPTFYNLNRQTKYYYLEITNRIRKVGFIHNCADEGSCTFSSRERRVEHSTTTLNGGRFFLITKCMAYPPRRS